MPVSWSDSLPAEALLDLVPVAVLVLGPDRRIVFANGAARDLMPFSAGDPVGLRPGDAFACANAAAAPEGCGSGRYCYYCGANHGIVAALSGTAEQAECRIARHDGRRVEQLELSVRAHPLPVGDETYVFFTVQDVSSEARRQILERIFLHDLMNTAGSLASLLRLVDPDQPESPEFLGLARSASDQLTDEILSFRTLSDAEAGSLDARFEDLDLAEAVEPVAATYGGIARSRGIGFDYRPPPSAPIRTDPVLLRRALSNLVKNAVEASDRGQHVGLAVRLEGAAAVVEVRNPAVMGAEVLAGIFKRSFSTKGRGRGLGAYAAKLFVEEHLGGALSCESAEGKGTVFTLSLPLGGPSTEAARTARPVP